MIAQLQIRLGKTITRKLAQHMTNEVTMSSHLTKSPINDDEIQKESRSLRDSFLWLHNSVNLMSLLLVHANRMGLPLYQTEYL